MNPAHFGIEAGTFPNVEKWAKGIGERPAVRRAMTVAFTA